MYNGLGMKFLDETVNDKGDRYILIIIIIIIIIIIMMMA